MLRLFKKLKRKRELKKLRKGFYCMADYLDEMTASGQITAEKAQNVIDTALLVYMDECLKPY